MGQMQAICEHRGGWLPLETHENPTRTAADSARTDADLMSELQVASWLCHKPAVYHPMDQLQILQANCESYRPASTPTGHLEILRARVTKGMPKDCKYNKFSLECYRPAVKLTRHQQILQAN